MLCMLRIHGMHMELNFNNLDIKTIWSREKGFFFCLAYIYAKNL